VSEEEPAVSKNVMATVSKLARPPLSRNLLRAVICVLIFLFSLTGALADPASLAPTQYSEGYYTPATGNASSLPGTLNGYWADSDGSISSVVSTAVPGLVSGSVSALGASGSAYANAYITGQFEVLGNPDTLVPLIVTGSGSVTLDGSAQFVAYLYVSDYAHISNQWVLESAYGYGCEASGAYLSTSTCNAYAPGFTLSETLMVTPGQQGNIELVAGGWARSGTLYGTDYGGSSSASGYADPIIEIDPTFLVDNPGYSLEFSPGFFGSNSSATPEPESIVLLSSGLLVLGAAARKRWRR
jgi:hypothetical protein